MYYILNLHSRKGFKAVASSNPQFHHPFSGGGGGWFRVLSENGLLHQPPDAV